MHQATSLLKPRESRRDVIVAEAQSGARMRSAETAGVTVSTRLPLRENWASATRASVLPLMVKRVLSWSLITTAEVYDELAKVRISRGSTSLAVVVTWWALQVFHRV